jgi:hypothetical protein
VIFWQQLAQQHSDERAAEDAGKDDRADVCVDHDQ